MASWSSERSSILSALLDDVVGTPQAVAIRQDWCRIYDCLESTLSKTNIYLTGSKAEGLDLPDSDLDYMTDQSIKVINSLDEISNISRLYNIFLMCTENVPLGFALLQHVFQTMNNGVLIFASPNMNGVPYLSSDLHVESYLFLKSLTGLPVTRTRQGPSLETWTEFCDKSKSGFDDVLSIHCDFWPTTALEWTQRPRHYGWPTSHDISTIIDFGCHLVPVGHPHSNTKLMEWRISFSVAERTLVWSFNHLQMQCYAVMKIILKEFIKVRCSPQNNVLCSYFIKTFLFWKYETNDVNFWRADNFRECLMYLLTGFSQCLREGVLRHYFIPRFNLLSVKFTRAAQAELLQLFDIIIQSDISVLRECRTLQKIWSELLHVDANKNMIFHNIKRRNMLQNDECMIIHITFIDPVITKGSEVHDQYDITSALLSLSCKTYLKTFILNRFLFWIHFTLLRQQDLGNKDIYELDQTRQSDTFSTDLSSTELWYAILLLNRRDYSSVLNITNQILSNIPPFVFYDKHMNNDGKRLYVDSFLDSGITVMQRAKKAWVFDLYLTKDIIDLLPIAMQIELQFINPVYDVVALSPFTCLFYLQFLCCHNMGQYDRRDWVFDIFVCLLVNKLYRFGNPCHTLNILGHCLLIMEDKDLALYCFNRSYRLSQTYPPHCKYNAALWYLQNYF